MSTDLTNPKIAIFKKPVFRLVIVSIFVVILGSFFIGSVIKNHQESKINLDHAVSQAIKAHNAPYEQASDIFPSESHLIYGKRKNGNQLTVYLHASYEEYVIDNPLGIVEQHSGSWCPCAITFEINENGSYKVMEYWEPSDGTYYASSIKKKFPLVYALLALYSSSSPPDIDINEVYEHFNASKTVTFISQDSGHLFCNEKGDAVLTLNTETSYATLKVNGKEILTDFYSFFDFDENGDPVSEYIYLCDVDNLPNNTFEYKFTIVDKNTLRVTNLPEEPFFVRAED